MGHASQPGADPRDAVLAVAAGDAQFRSLGAAQRAAAHELIDSRIAQRAATEHFGVAAAHGGESPPG